MNCPYTDECSENKPPPALSQDGPRRSSSYANYAKLHIPMPHSLSHTSTYIRKHKSAVLWSNMISNRKMSPNCFVFASCLAVLLDMTQRPLLLSVVWKGLQIDLEAYRYIHEFKKPVLCLKLLRLLSCQRKLRKLELLDTFENVTMNKLSS